VFLPPTPQAHGRGGHGRRPRTTYAKFKVMGKEFDPAKPDEYLNSFKIKKAAESWWP
jgi:hypothetical protein